MKIELSYKYSDLDKEPQFGLVIEGVKEVYARWIYFYIGVHIGTKKQTIYPFKRGRILYSYKYLNDAERQGLLIVNKIKKQLLKLKWHEN